MTDSERQQDEPTAIRPEQEPQGSGDPSQDVSSTRVDVPVGSQSPQSPYRKKKTGRKGVECRDRWRLGVEIVALLVGTVGLYALIQTLSETRKATNAATDALHSQRPYVNVGKEDGTIAEYIPPPDGKGKGVIKVYFQNTGSAPALSFIANVHSWWHPGLPSVENHIQRFKYIDKRTGKSPGHPIYGHGIVGSHSTHIVTIPLVETPSIDEWKLIENRTLESSYMLGGNVEYCDWWGKYHCTDFMIWYSPSPDSRFIAKVWECVSAPLVAEPMHGDDIILEQLPRCEQPQERQNIDAREKIENRRE